MSDQPAQDENTISRHLRSMHGYDLAYATAAHPKTLLDEHERIHRNLETNHEHPEPAGR